MFRDLSFIDFLIHFGRASGEFLRPLNPAKASLRRGLSPSSPIVPIGTEQRISPELLILRHNSRIRVCPGPPAPPMGPKAPGGGKAPRPPVSRSGQMGPGTRAGPGDPACRRWGKGFGWDDPAEGSGGRQGLPLARAGVGSQARRTPSGRDRGSGRADAKKKVEICHGSSVGLPKLR